jgi:hypothetical protein
MPKMNQLKLLSLRQGVQQNFKELKGGGIHSLVMYHYPAMT